MTNTMDFDAKARIWDSDPVKRGRALAAVAACDSGYRYIAILNRPWM